MVDMWIEIAINAFQVRVIVRQFRYTANTIGLNIDVEVVNDDIKTNSNHIARSVKKQPFNVLVAPNLAGMATVFEDLAGRDLDKDSEVLNITKHTS